MAGKFFLSVFRVIRRFAVVGMKSVFFCYLCCLKVAVSAKVYRLFASLAARRVALAPLPAAISSFSAVALPKIQRAAQLVHKQTRCRNRCVYVCVGMSGRGAVLVAVVKTLRIAALATLCGRNSLPCLYSIAPSFGASLRFVVRVRSFALAHNFSMCWS